MCTYSIFIYYFLKRIYKLRVKVQDKDSEFHPETKATSSTTIQLPAQ